jgi:serine/threonine-protein kinase
MTEPPDPSDPGDDPPPGRPPEDPGDDTPGQGLPEPDPALPPTVPDSAAATRSGRPPAAPGGAPTSFCRYERLEPLPRGGMADVFKAWDPVLKIDVALKVTKYPLSDTDAVEAERFLRDARALARLDHPNIVRVYDVGTEDGRAYFTMGFMIGGSLDQHPDRFADPRSAAALVEKIARAMHFVHEHGVLHRDLKPGNILLDDQGEPRVSDFGLAKFRDDDLEITHQGVVMGTFPYMAPEQARGQVDRFGPTTDVWALGVILYELLTRRRPFEAKSRQAVASLICSAEPPLPSAARPELDSSLEAVVLKCLEKKAQDRYASAEDLAKDLRFWLAGERTVAQPPTGAERAWRFVRRHRASAAAACLLTSLCLLLWFWPARPNRGLDTQPTNVSQSSREFLGHVQSQLARGTAVELIPPAGLPNWFRRRVGENIDFSRADLPGADLKVRNFKHGLVDLVPESPKDGYRLKAEVLIANPAQTPAAGIYIAARDLLAPDGVTEQWWVNLAFPFDDSHPTARLVLHRWHPGSGLQLFNNQIDLLQHKIPGGQWSGAWRDLSVEVRPGGIVAFYAGECIGAVNLDQIDVAIKSVSKIQIALPGTARPAPSWLLGGSLGIYNEEADTSFRQISVEPIE